MSMHDHLTLIRLAMASTAPHSERPRKPWKPAFGRLVRFNVLVASAVFVSVTAAYFAGCMSA